MIWILATLGAALANSSWIALSQRPIRAYSSTWFTLYFHIGMTLFLIPDFLYAVHLGGWAGIAGLGAAFLGGRGASRAFRRPLGFGCKALACAMIITLTFAVSNTAPVLVLFLAPLSARVIPHFPAEQWGWGTIPGTLVIAGAVLLLLRGGMNRAALYWGGLTSLTYAVLSLGTRWGVAGAQTPENHAWIVHAFNAPQALAGTLTLCVISGRELFAGRGRPPAASAPADSIASADKSLAFRYLVLASFIAAFSAFSYNLAFLYAPSAAQPSALVRVNIFFGFCMSYWLLRERDQALSRAISGALIVAGAVLVTLK